MLHIFTYFLTILVVSVHAKISPCQVEDILFAVPDYECPTNFTLFNRYNGVYCMQVINATSISAFAASSACQLINASLASIENRNEMAFILSEAQVASNNTTGFVWLGAERRGACYGTDYTTNVACLPVTTFSFLWTDGFAEGTSGFNYFASGQPDNSGGVENCLGLVSSVSSVADNTNGTIYDFACDRTTSVIGYVCGMPASVVVDDGDDDDDDDDDD